MMTLVLVEPNGGIELRGWSKDTDGVVIPIKTLTRAAKVAKERGKAVGVALLVEVEGRVTFPLVEA